MLLLTPSMSKPKRIQGAWVTDDEVNKITDHLRMQRPPQYDDEIVAQPVQLNGKGGVVMDFDGGGDDDMSRDAVRVVVDSRKASTSLLQRKLLHRLWPCRSYHGRDGRAGYHRPG